MRSAPRPIPAALPLLAMLALAGCGDIKGADDRQLYVKPPLDEPGLTVGAEEPTTMDELGDPRERVPQTEATFIAPARPARPQQQTPPAGSAQPAG